MLSRTTLNLQKVIIDDFIEDKVMDLLIKSSTLSHLTKLLVELISYLKEINISYIRRMVVKDMRDVHCDDENIKQNLTLKVQLSSIEYYVRQLLENNKWDSGKNEINKIIRHCQENSLIYPINKTSYPIKIVEWIPYNQLKEVQKFKKGGNAQLHTAIWSMGPYTMSLGCGFSRTGPEDVILKEIELDNFDEDPASDKFLLVLERKTYDLREYLGKNHSTLTWKHRYEMLARISEALNTIHNNNLIHRDLHSGNILYDKCTWVIGDFGLSVPINSSELNIKGVLLYIAPELLNGGKYTTKTDVYSFGMIMWEIYSEKPPFFDREKDELATHIVMGSRPDIVSDIPIFYALIMQRCWDPDPNKRPDINTLNKLFNLASLFHFDNWISREGYRYLLAFAFYLLNICHDDYLYFASSIRTLSDNSTLSENDLSGILKVTKFIR
ncbi:16407_t:CDS:2 [Racocetra fulgida]|uniref:16407_t:CDS:1 n=1 Tax=Racocetra fulgida TaxID=60492 RepID=A0A9N8VMG1_9GLOM|nr:16407_t:CDS:2 [Racocetra fulgida]